MASLGYIWWSAFAAVATTPRCLRGLPLHRGSGAARGSRGLPLRTSPVAPGRPGADVRAVLPPRAAKAAVPILTGISLAGFIAVALRGPRSKQARSRTGARSGGRPAAGRNSTRHSRDGLRSRSPASPVGLHCRFRQRWVERAVTGGISNAGRGSPASRRIREWQFSGHRSLRPPGRSATGSIRRMVHSLTGRSADGPTAGPVPTCPSSRSAGGFAR